jgi:ribosome biogenesis GTPase
VKKPSWDVKKQKTWEIKKRIQNRDLEFEISEDDSLQVLDDDEKSFLARVVEVQKRYAFVAVEDEDGKLMTRDVWLGTMARKFLPTQRLQRNLLTVGDRVLCREADENQGEESDLPRCTIERRLPRISQLVRLDPLSQKREHVLAVNVTQMLVVASIAAPHVRWGVIDRFLALAEDQKIKVRIIINKSDLLPDMSAEIQYDVKVNIADYRRMGYEVLITQAAHERDPALASWFKKHTSVLLGHSGVGKSSIINQLKPEIEQDVETEVVLTKGRHTTTYASFIRLGTGGFVIDTPGIRSLVLEAFDPTHLSWCFIDMRPFVGTCKFRECRHIEEPHCAVKQAVADGKVSQRRYDSYVNILTGTSQREGRSGLLDY